MTVSEAMRAAAENGCDLQFDAARKVWVVNKIAIEADTVELDESLLERLSIAQFVEDYLPEPL